MTVGARHCPRCGARLAGPPPTTCGSCAYALFVNPRPTGCVVILRDAAVLLLRRSAEPRRNLWALPGGFCEGFEHPSDAAVREAREELGVGVRLDDFVGMYLGVYEFQDERLPVLDCFWLATVTDGEPVANPQEASEVRWFRLDEVPDLAFDTMNRAMADLRARR